MKVILGYEGLYSVTKTGKIWSHKRKYFSGRNHRTEKWTGDKFLNPGHGYWGHEQVILAKGSVMKRYLVHRLVAQAYIPNPENKPQINHKDGNPRNNNIANLEWCTQRENNIHALNTGARKLPKGNNHWSRRQKVNRDSSGRYFRVAV